MKTLRAASVLLVLVFLLGIASCTREVVVFVPDSSDPQLPAYTENGNEIGGALINNAAWKSYYFQGFDTPSIYPLHFFNFFGKDSAVIEFVGQRNVVPNNGAPISFFVSISKFQIPLIEDLLNLSGKTFPLNGVNNVANVFDYLRTINSRKDRFVGGSGELVIKKVKPILSLTATDRNGMAYHPMIMAGTFKFNFPADSVTIDSGRFDFVIYDSDYAILK